MLTEEYTVRLEQFEGPLDLLLFLIRRAELDVSVIAIAQITDQYMRFLQGVEHIDVDVAGEFLVIAATLLEIKSRTVAPPAEGEAPSLRSLAGDGDAQADPGATLVRQLLHYKAYRDAADRLEARRDSWERCYPNARASFDREAALRSFEDDAIDDEDIELIDLIHAFKRIIETVQFDRLGDHEITYDDTPIAEHEADIVDRLRAGESCTAPFRSLFEGRTRVQMIGLFLALLELVRQRAISVVQSEAGGEILLTLDDENAASILPLGAIVEPKMNGTAPIPTAWDDDHIFDDDEDLDDDGEVDASSTG